MLNVIDKQTINEDFGVPEGACADCGELVIFSRNIWDKQVWLHKVDRGNGYFGFDADCPTEKE